MIATALLSHPRRPEASQSHGSLQVSMQVQLRSTLSATRWHKHGDHPAVERLNGFNWDKFPNENDDNCGLLAGRRLVNAGDWIVWCETFQIYGVFTHAEFEAKFSADNIEC